MQFVQCSGHRPECARCTKRGFICEYSVPRRRSRSVPVPPFQVNYPGVEGTGGGQPSLRVAQTNTFERTPAHARATRRYSLLPATLQFSPATPTYKSLVTLAPSSADMYWTSRVERELIIPRREPDASQWDFPPSPLSQCHSQVSMNSSFEALCPPPTTDADNFPNCSHPHAQDKDPNPFNVYNSTGLYVPPDHLAHPVISASSSGGLYDRFLPADFNAGDVFGIGELFFQHFLTQVGSPSATRY